jgi:hypothetical protein
MLAFAGLGRFGVIAARHIAVICVLIRLAEPPSEHAKRIQVIYQGDTFKERRKFLDAESFANNLTIDSACR